MTLKRVLHTGQTYSSESLRHEKIDLALLQMLAQDMQPASIVEDAGFQSLAHLLDSRYLLASRRTLTRQLPSSKRVCEIKQELSSTPCEALTSDIWTSTTTQSYLTLTYHFITASWEMKVTGSGNFRLLQQPHSRQHCRSPSESCWILGDFQ